VEDIEDVVHIMLDLLSSMSSSLSTALTTSPSTPSSPSPYSTVAYVSNPNASPNSSPAVALLSSSTSITRLKIALKENEHEPRERAPLSQIDPTVEFGANPEAEGLGRNEGTVRFLFGPE